MLKKNPAVFFWASDLPTYLAWGLRAFLWAGDIAYIYARFCPDMDRDAARIMGQTDATPFMENVDAHFASISGWVEDEADLGDADEFDDGDEIISDDDDTDDEG